jgi:hypothetical protein
LKGGSSEANKVRDKARLKMRAHEVEVQRVRRINESSQFKPRTPRAKRSVDDTVHLLRGDAAVGVLL